MYKNIIERMNKEVKDRNEKNKATLSAMTNKEVLNNWAYSKMVTAKACEEIKNSLPDSSIPADALNRTIKSLDRKTGKRLQAYLDQIEKVDQAKNDERITISVVWHKSKTWGYCPTATVSSSSGKTTGYASGCGYDKLSAAIASALNENPAALKPLYDHAENGQMFPYSVHLCNGLPQFDGGCGVSCFASIYEACGYKFVEIANDDLFNVYQIETL